MTNRETDKPQTPSVELPDEELDQVQGGIAGSAAGLSGVQANEVSTSDLGSGRVKGVSSMDLGSGRITKISGTDLGSGRVK